MSNNSIGRNPEILYSVFNSEAKFADEKHKNDNLKYNHENNLPAILANIETILSGDQYNTASYLSPYNNQIRHTPNKSAFSEDELKKRDGQIENEYNK